MKKLLALTLALCMVLCMFAGCNGGGNGDDNVDLAGTYDIKVWVAEAIVDLTKTQIAKFNETNTLGITINATVEAVGEGEAATAMTTDVEAGADIYCFAQDQTARLIQGAALSKLGVGAQKTVTEANDAGVVAAATAGGEMWAYPLTADNGYFMFYDKSVVSENHIDSLEDIISDCEKAGKLFSFELEGSAWYTASFFFATGCVSEFTTDADGAFTDVNDTFNSAEGVIASKGMLKLLSSTCYNNSSKTADFEAAIPSAVVVSGAWDYETAKSILGDNLGIADLPSFTVDGQSYHLGSFNGCKLMGVKPQVDAKKSAAIHQLAQYLTNEECQMERFKQQSWGPANLNAQASDAVKANPGLVALAAQAPYSVPQGQYPGAFWDNAKVLPTNLRQNGEAGIQAALDAYKASIDAIFNLSDDVKNAFTVIGTVGGSNWSTDLPMTEQADGTWKSDEAYEMAEGDTFKCRQGKDWNVAYGDPVNGDADGNYMVATAGTYYVVLDPSTGTITLVAA